MPTTAPRPAAPPRRPSVWACVASLLIAVALFVGAAILVRDYRHMSRDGIPVEGRMTGSYERVTHTRNGSVTGTDYNPSFSYLTREGATVIGTVPDSVDYAEIRPGRTMALRYDPENPKDVRLASALEGGPGVLPWLFAGLGVLVAWFSVRGLLPFLRR
ncbi:DUF3592 domain-containing protein [Roseomonas sp. NAR14]|uniref:DUF3592 domain-containing protein n=1 Tax=Roseomonas acroporae TaxID=2937791 RepID=A0A9X1YCC0_9PROT|nr:DUF3592 domain-containing protein [Roseomonas acroporae]MCK8787536.1 DUF3592 domain-containing protein [Roseomonas acroporae]